MHNIDTDIVDPRRQSCRDNEMIIVEVKARFMEFGICLQGYIWCISRSVQEPRALDGMI